MLMLQLLSFLCFVAAALLVALLIPYSTSILNTTWGNATYLAAALCRNWLSTIRIGPESWHIGWQSIPMLWTTRVRGGGRLTFS